MYHRKTLSYSYFRFKDRVFIPDKSTRSLLKAFCKTGITETEFLELERLIKLHAPSLLLLLQFLRKQIDVNILCPREWSKFITNLASPSPVCALIYPDKQLFTLLKELCSNDITSDMAKMKMLQENVPVLFNVLTAVNPLPQRCMLPLIDALIAKCNAPFGSESKPATKQDVPATPVLQDLSYFPRLPCNRVRGTYLADQYRNVSEKCTKLSSGHPTLLPGLFTLFCPHGK